MKIAVLLGGMRFDSQRNVMNGILEAAQQDGADVYAFTGDAWTYSNRYFSKGETEIFSLPHFEDYDGVILHGDTIYDEDMMDRTVAAIQKAGVPCISLSVSYPGMLCAEMENDNGLYKIAEHMIQVHHARTLAFVSGPEGNSDSEGRLLSFRKALADNGIAVDERYIFYGDYHPEGGRRAVSYFCDKLGALPDVIVAANDEMALGALFELGNRGIKVPDHVLLSGYDYTDMARTHYPQLTSVKRPEKELGQQAYLKLRAHIRGEEIPEEKLYSEPVFAGSCGCEDKERESERVIGERAVRDKVHVTTYSEIIKSSSADFTGAVNFEQLLEQIKKYIMMIDPQEFYLCMCVTDEPDVDKEDAESIVEEIHKKVTAEETTYASEIYIPLLYVNGKFGSYGRFAVEKLLPEELTEGKAAGFYTVMPVHYQNRCYGYCVLQGSRLMLDSPMFHLLIMNINNALESLRKQEILNDMVQRLDKIWVYDTLTNVYNRAGFFRYAYPIIEEARQAKKNLFVLFLDLDGLKSVNDKYGHDQGDEFIKAMGKVLSQVRSHGQLLMRYGGDEFVILGTGFTPEAAEAYMEQIRRGIDNYNAASNRPYLLDASMGYTLMDPSEEFDLEEVIESADQEMYKAKKAKKNRAN